MKMVLLIKLGEK